MGITFKGITSDSLGVTVNILPNFIKPQRRNEVVLIDGKDGANILEYGYAPYILKMRITVKTVANLDTIIAWLDGDGVLITPDDPLKYRNVKVLNMVDYAKLMKYKSAEVEFYVADPFRYILSEANTTLVAPGNYTNNGTIASEPLLKLTGSGTVILTIGSQSFTYVFDTPFVYIDCQSKDAYYSNTYKNRKMTGSFPVLNKGVNAISWTGTLTELVITPRTRYL